MVDRLVTVGDDYKLPPTVVTALDMPTLVTNQLIGPGKANDKLKELSQLAASANAVGRYIGVGKVITINNWQVLSASWTGTGPATIAGSTLRAGKAGIYAITLAMRVNGTPAGNRLILSVVRSATVTDDTKELCRYTYPPGEDYGTVSTVQNFAAAEPIGPRVYTTPTSLNTTSVVMDIVYLGPIGA